MDRIGCPKPVTLRSVSSSTSKRFTDLNHVELRKATIQLDPGQHERSRADPSRAPGRGECSASLRIEDARADNRVGGIPDGVCDLRVRLTKKHFDERRRVDVEDQ
jgi:hypothetical protein